MNRGGSGSLGGRKRSQAPVRTFSTFLARGYSQTHLSLSKSHFPASSQDRMEFSGKITESVSGHKKGNHGALVIVWCSPVTQLLVDTVSAGPLITALWGEHTGIIMILISQRKPRPPARDLPEPSTVPVCLELRLEPWSLEPRALCTHTELWLREAEQQQAKMLPLSPGPEDLSYF